LFKKEKKMNLDQILSFMYVESTRLNDQGYNSESVYTSEQLAVQALNTLGLTYCSNKMFDKSILAFESAVKIDEGNWLLWSNIAHVYSVQDNRIKALDAALRSVEYCNKSAFDPYYNAGVILTSLNRIEEAKEMYKTALQIRPDDANANYNYGLLLLRTGLCKEGWEKYEYRFETSKLTGKFKERFCGRPSGLVQPHWDGRKYKNKSLLVYSEQGLGDFIFFARFLPMVKKLGGKLIVEIQDPLKNIVGSNLKIDELVVRPNNIDWPTAPESTTVYRFVVCQAFSKFILKIKVPTEPYIFCS
jgi:tetratricopeptide (TPR) repeat protein